MISPTRHPLRFVLWTLVAVWATATIAAGITYVVIRAEESGEAQYHGRDYNQQRCTFLAARRSLEKLTGFTPLGAGEAALVTRTEGVRDPATIYVWRSHRGCVTQWSLEHGL